MIACKINQNGTSTVGTNDHGSCCIAAEPGPVKTCKAEPSADVTPSVKTGALMRTNRPDRESGRSNGQHDYGDYDEREVGVRHRQCTALDGNSIRASSKPSRSNDCSAIGDGNRFQKRLTVGRAKRLSG